MGIENLIVGASGNVLELRNSAYARLTRHTYHPSVG